METPPYCFFFYDMSGDVAQLVRALPCHGRGRGFEPRRPRHKPKKVERFMAASSDILKIQ
jgi:hypothetical protein